MVSSIEDGNDQFRSRGGSTSGNGEHALCVILSELCFGKQGRVSRLHFIAVMILCVGNKSIKTCLNNI